VQFGVGFIATVILGFQTVFELRFGFGFIFCSGFLAVAAESVRSGYYIGSCFSYNLLLFSNLG
ncbi:TPA: hypothetical protein ACJMF3_002126, partial [Neisseria meningitidis]